MDCPVCCKPLIVVEREKIELDYCIICKGFWFDEGEMQLLAKTLNCTLDTDNLQKYSKGIAIEKQYKCPRCDTTMEKVFIGYTPVDRCPKGHGMWFDKGELEKVFSQYAEYNDTDKSPVIKFLGMVFNSGKINQIEV